MVQVDPNEANCEDASLPVITLLGQETGVTVPQCGSYSDSGAIAVDNLDGNLTEFITVTTTRGPLPLETVEVSIFFSLFKRGGIRNKRDIKYYKIDIKSSHIFIQF